MRAIEVKVHKRRGQLYDIVIFLVLEAFDFLRERLSAPDS